MKFGKTSFIAMLIFCWLSCTAKISKPQVACTMQDTTKFYNLEKFERAVKTLLKGNAFNFKKEEMYPMDILNSKQKAIEYAKIILQLIYPNFQPLFEDRFTITDDSTSKLWFVNYSLPNSTFGGHIRLIIVKNNCKLLYYFKAS